MIQLIIATGNKGKVRDFQCIFESVGLDIEMSPVSDWVEMEEVDETGTTFEANARIKADATKSALSKHPDVWVVADDSGIAVDALDGKPGVHSARFAGPTATDEDNRNQLLKALEGLPETERGASFVCNLCLIDPHGSVFHFEATCSGVISDGPKGDNGFGYDPLFIQEGTSLTWGERSTEKKTQDNHRARAVRLLIQHFQNL